MPYCESIRGTQMSSPMTCTVKLTVQAMQRRAIRIFSARAATQSGSSRRPIAPRPSAAGYWMSSRPTSAAAGTECRLMPLLGLTRKRWGQVYTRTASTRSAQYRPGLDYLLERCDDGKWHSLSHREIGGTVGISHTSVRNVLVRLDEWGLISRELQRNPKTCAACEVHSRKIRQQLKARTSSAPTTACHGCTEDPRTAMDPLTQQLMQRAWNAEKLRQQKATIKRIVTTCANNPRSSGRCSMMTSVPHSTMRRASSTDGQVRPNAPSRQSTEQSRRNKASGTAQKPHVEALRARYGGDSLTNRFATPVQWQSWTATPVTYRAPLRNAMRWIENATRTRLRMDAGRHLRNELKDRVNEGCAQSQTPSPTVPSRWPTCCIKRSRGSTERSSETMPKRENSSPRSALSGASADRAGQQGPAAKRHLIRDIAEAMYANVLAPTGTVAFFSPMIRLDIRWSWRRHRLNLGDDHNV